MKYFFLAAIVFLIMIIPLSLATQTVITQTTSTVKGCIIDYPKLFYIEKNKSFDFEVHVINSSNGVPISLDYISCTLHIYDYTGEHIYVNDSPKTSNVLDIEWQIDSSLFTNLGHHSYIVQCNRTDLGCFSSADFFVTQKGGVEPAGDGMQMLIWLLFIVIIGGMLFVLILNVAKLATTSETIFDVLVSWIFYMSLLVVDYLSKTFMITDFVTKITTLMVTITAFTHVILPLIALFVTMFKKGTDKTQPVSISDLTGRRLLYG